MTLDELREKYVALCHAMQSGVAFKMEHEPAETQPKHLRVGVNSAMVDTGTIVKLLLDKGLITEIEFYEALVHTMEREVESYTKYAQEKLGTKITFK